MYHSSGLKIPSLDLRGLGQDRESEGCALDFSGGNEMCKAVRLFAERAHLECCTEVRLLVVNSPFLFVCIFFVMHY